MRFREFNPKKDEGALDTIDAAADTLVPFYGAGKSALKGKWGDAATQAATDAALMAVGGPVAKAGLKLGGKALGKLGKYAVDKAAGAAQKAMTPQGIANIAGKQVGKKIGLAGFNKQTAADDTPMSLKPGMNVVHPELGQLTIKTVAGPDATLDTKKLLGQDIKVDKDELADLLSNKSGAGPNAGIGTH